MRIYQMACAAGVALVCAGCCTPRHHAPMTVADAMQEVASGLNAFSAQSLEKRSGLLPDEVIVVLNVSDEQTSTAGASVNAAAGTSKLLVDFSRQDSETRANQITIKFRSLLLAEKSTILGTKSPEEIAAIYQGVTNANFLLKAPAR